MAGEALDVFISYSHRDEGLKDELVNYHLKLLQREGKINTSSRAARQNFFAILECRGVGVGAMHSGGVLMVLPGFNGRFCIPRPTGF